MKDWLGNPLKPRDFILIDSAKFNGKNTRVGIVVAIDEAKGWLHYLMCYKPTSNWPIQRKKTKMLNSVTLYDTNLIPMEVCKELWDEVNKHV